MGPLAALYVDWEGSVLSETPHALYFFKERQYIRWDVEHEQLYSGYPRNIRDGWPGLLDVYPSAQLNSAIYVPGWHNRIYFFFRGCEHAVVWDVASHSLDPEPVLISQLLPSSLTAEGSFAPVYVDRGDTQMVYVFRGDAYTRFTVRAGDFSESEDAGYPRKIGDGWTGGLTVAPSCAVSVRWTHRDPSLMDHKLYFFLGELYTRWDISSHSNNYRLDIPSGWVGWPDFD